jgi:peptidylprolyl isomerase
MILAAKSDTVKIHYTGRLADGTVFDQSPPDRPLMFILGKQEVIEGFDEAVTGMKQGSNKTVTIPCSKAYGPSKPELIDVIERAQLPEDVELTVGGQLEVTNDDDSKFYLMIRNVTEQNVTLDANHPLAGQDLTFELELLEVIKPTATPEQPDS